MTALTRSITPNEIKGKLYRFPVAAATKIFGGALVVLNDGGFAESAATAVDLRAVGIAEPTGIIDNSDGDDGDQFVLVRPGIWGLQNSSGGDLITPAEMGHTVYIVDDQTVAKTSAGGTRSPAGAVRMIEGDLVYVDIGMPSSIDGDLLAGNNLSDIASPATARANIGANKVALTLHASNLVGADAKVYRVVSPVAGTLKTARTVIDKALAGGDSTLTTKINNVAVTNGVVTITQAGSAAGDTDVATATAANTVAIGDVISLTAGGAQSDTAVTANITLYIET